VANRVEWHGDEAMDHCRKRALGFLTRAAIEVTRRAKELLSIPGTAFTTKLTRKAAGIARGKRFARAEKAAAAYNTRHAKSIVAGKTKAMRVTGLANLTTRRHKNRPT
jgi:hypothetical protein